MDRRDNRGKRHPLALVLTDLVAALCCGRDGNLSRLHGSGHPMAYVALTGYKQQEDRRRSREAGFDANLVKPVDIYSLTQLLRVVTSG